MAKKILLVADKNRSGDVCKDFLNNYKLKNKDMKIENIKKEMKGFTDLYGGELLNFSEIDACKTKKELKQIMESHRNHMESMATDADKHLDNFMKKVKLYIL